jgi:arylsulfatase A-like enzyme
VPRETPPPRGLPGEGFQTPRAEAVVDLARRFVRSHSDDRFFLYTQLWDPHEPYNRCQAEIEPFRDVTPLPPHPTADEIDAHRSWDTVRGATDMNIASRGDVQELLARYDAEIRYADDHVGRLMEALKREELYAETLVVITADHGEEFGEHGSYRHHWSTHDGTQRIPLIIKPPSSVGGPSGASCDALVTNVDVGPTVAACLDIEPPSGWQGRSLTSLVADPDAGRDGAWRPYLVVDHGLYMAQRAVRTDRWKLVKTYHPGLWAEVTPSIQLFDLPADPWEQSNVAADYPDVVARLTGYRREWVDEHRGPAEDSLRRVAREGPAGYRWFTDAFDGM